MRSLFLVLLPVIFLFSPAQIALAQSSESPVPLAVLKDADGKVIAPLAGFSSPRVMLNFGGIVGVYDVNPTKGQFGQQITQFYFSGSNCTGSRYLYTVNPLYYDTLNGFITIILGPNVSDGTYQVFRTTSLTEISLVPLSRQTLGVCENLTRGVTYDRLRLINNILPNPMEGFHGPTTANPERVLTIEGGTRLP